MTAGTRRVLPDIPCESPVLMGRKNGCGHGQSGAWLGDDPQSWGVVLPTEAVTVRRQVPTIEGITGEDASCATQEAIFGHDLYRSGCCTPRQIPSTIAWAAEGQAGAEREMAEGMSSSLCGWVACPQICRAIRHLAQAEARTAG